MFGAYGPPEEIASYMKELLPPYSKTLICLSAPTVTMISLLMPIDMSSMDPMIFPFGNTYLIGKVKTFLRTLS